jgi:hypothetical protein
MTDKLASMVSYRGQRIIETPAARSNKINQNSWKENAAMSALLGVVIATMFSIVGIVGGLFQQALAF